MVNLLQVCIYLSIFSLLRRVHPAFKHCWLTAFRLQLQHGLTAWVLLWASLAASRWKQNFKTIFLCWENPLKEFRGNGAVCLTQLQSASSLVPQQVTLQSFSNLCASCLKGYKIVCIIYSNSWVVKQKDWMHVNACRDSSGSCHLCSIYMSLMQ